MPSWRKNGRRDPFVGLHDFRAADLRHRGVDQVFGQHGVVFDGGEFLGSAHGGLRLEQDLLAFREAGVGALDHLGLGFRDGEIEFGYRAQLLQRFAEHGWVGRHHHREIGGVEVLFGGTQQVGARHGLQRLLILRKEVLRIAVVIQHHLAREQFGPAVMGEDQAVDRRIPRIPPLVLGDFGAADAVDLLEDGLDGCHCGDALGAAGDFEQAGVAVPGVPGGADVVGDAQFGAQAVGDAALGSAAQDARQDFERGTVLIVAPAAEVSHGKEGLRNVLRLGQEDAGRGRVFHLREFGNGRLLHGPIGKQLLDCSLHFGSIEIAPDAERDVGREKVSLMELRAGRCG